MCLDRLHTASYLKCLLETIERGSARSERVGGSHDIPVSFKSKFILALERVQSKTSNINNFTTKNGGVPD